MAKSKGKGLKDPVEEQSKDIADEELAKEMASLDVGKYNEGADDNEGAYLQSGELGAIHERRTSAPHPFDGYKLGRKVPVGSDDKLSVSSTYLVILKTADEPVPDPSNDAQTVYTSPKEGGGGSPSKGRPRVVTLPTSHTRVVTTRKGNENISVVFDREIMVDGRWLKCAIVREHAARAQICFTYDDQRKKLSPDKSYLLADTKQAIPLLKMAEAIYYQRTKAEKAAREFDAAIETTAADR